jgi:hypothetical protein
VAVGLPEPLKLRWLPDGARVLVGERWLFDPEVGTFASFDCTPRGGPRVPDCSAVGVSFSPDGRVLIVAGSWLTIGRSGGAAGEKIDVPRWLPHRGTEGEDNMVSVGFWLSPGEVLLQQFDHEDPSHPACRILALDTRRWRTPKGGCLEGGLHYLWRVEPGAGGWVALYSGGEGANDVTLARYSEDAGQTETGAPDLTPEPSAAISATFRRDGSVDVISQCPLEKGGPACFGDGDPAHWRLYSWPGHGRPLTLRRSDLRPGSAIDPRRGRLAWPQGRSVCVGEPADRKARCVPVPHQ